MRLVKAAVMRSLDQEAWQRYGIPGVVLMENAGLSVVQHLLEHFWERRPAGRRSAWPVRRLLLLPGRGLPDWRSASPTAGIMPAPWWWPSVMRKAGSEMWAGACLKA